MFNKLSSVAVLIFGAYLCLSFTTGDAIMCYNCTSVDNAACADPMGTNVSMRTCADDVSSCVKIVASLRNSTNTTIPVTYRDCLPYSNATCTTMQESLNGTGSYNGALEQFSCSTCDTDHCNSAVTFGVSLIAVGLTFVAARML